MSAIKDILAGLKTAIELNGKVVAVAGAVERLTTDMRDLDRRVVRLETIVEIARPDGAVLRIAPKPGSVPPSDR
ncbi:hypothetical protein HL658_31870 [Azospirillum sp. RWY-5-1]|uniref:Uncharacterized protein n=1 Tax=Azospirillum oleiclasticum TaxID=2735135 RepID=A0ABX2TH96_9PROT|nr:hypothetical protein [Azospirillum oleiclasticum]NYZ17166.1 hypothetical protein [Azospirillum oleiclasticum]NYZ23125.1 hypothetical protein [Azospirillum oleiclasticum]